MRKEIGELILSYYRLSKGILPSDTTIAQTEKTVNFLLDNNYSDKDIMQILINIGKTEAILPEDLPDELWEGMLTERDVFYYHSELHITSKPPKWDPISMKEIVEPFFMEMKIKYTMNDLLTYYYNSLCIPIELRDDKKDTGAFKHLLDKYKKMKVKPLDFVLTLIDFASRNEDEKIVNVLDLGKYEAEVFNHYEAVIPMATYERVNRIIWR